MAHGRGRRDELGGEQHGARTSGDGWAPGWDGKGKVGNGFPHGPCAPTCLKGGFRDGGAFLGSGKRRKHQQNAKVNRPLAKLLDCYEWCKSTFISQKQVIQPPQGGSGNLRHGALATVSAGWPCPITLSPSLEFVC